MVSHIQSRTISEGDLIVIFSQFGEVVDVRLTRHPKTGAVVGGMAYLCFEDWRSAVLAADNMNSRAIRSSGQSSSKEGNTNDDGGAAVFLTEPETNTPSDAVSAENEDVSSSRRVGGRSGGGGGGGRGICVERCEESQVPPLRADFESYGEWYERCFPTN